MTVELDFDGEVARIPTVVSKEFVQANVLTVAVGTTGEMGGDWGHGCRTYIRLGDRGGTGWAVRVRHAGKAHTYDVPETVEILAGGDSEMETLIETLKFIVATLSEQKAKKE